MQVILRTLLVLTMHILFTIDHDSKLVYGASLASDDSVACRSPSEYNGWVCDPHEYLTLNEISAINAIIDDGLLNILENRLDEVCPCQTCFNDTAYYKIFVVVLNSTTGNNETLDRLETIKSRARSLRDDVFEADGGCNDTVIIVMAVHDETWWPELGCKLKTHLNLHCVDKIISETGVLLSHMWLADSLAYFIDELVYVYYDARPCHESEPVWVNVTLIPFCLGVFVITFLNSFVQLYYRLSLVRYYSRKFSRLLHTAMMAAYHEMIRLHGRAVCCRNNTETTSCERYAVQVSTSYETVSIESFTAQQLFYTDLFQPGCNETRYHAHQETSSPFDPNKLQLPVLEHSSELHQSRLVYRDNFAHLTHNYDDLTLYMSDTVHVQGLPHADDSITALTGNYSQTTQEHVTCNLQIASENMTCDLQTAQGNMTHNANCDFSDDVTYQVSTTRLQDVYRRRSRHRTDPEARLTSSVTTL